MKITSSTFESNQEIPEKYTCDGEDVNPPLRFEDVPTDAAALALVLSDPDAPGKTFYHWVLFNMDIDTGHIDEDSVPSSVVEGINDSGNTEYAGPCPPAGIHQYIFTLYALDGSLDLAEGATAKEVLEEIEGHVIETAQLTGKYTKK